MKRLIAMTVMMGLCAGGALLQAQTKAADAKTPAASSGSVTEEITKIEKDWVAAVKAKDAAKLSEILADSWVGLWLGRQDYRQAHESG